MFLRLRVCDTMVLGPVTLDTVVNCEYMTILIEYILQCMLGKCNVLLEYIINGVCIYLNNKEFQHYTNIIRMYL